MIIFIFGQENFLVQQKFSDLKKDYLAKNPQAQIEVFDLDDDEVKEVEDSLQGGTSLFSPKKLLILRNIFSLPKTSYEKMHELIKKASKENGDLTMMIVESGKPKGKILNYLKRNAKLLEFKQLDQAQLKKWVTDEVKNRSGGQLTISQDALTTLCEITQCNLWHLHNEVEKLIQFCSKGEISATDLEEISKGQIETGIFDLVDAIGIKDKPRAIELKNNLVMQGDNEFYIFSMIHTQLRNIMKVSECASKGITDHGQVSKLCSMHPFVAKKTLSQQGKFKRGELKEIFSLAAKIDVMAKSGKVNIDEALDYFIVKV